MLFLQVPFYKFISMKTHSYVSKAYCAITKGFASHLNRIITQFSLPVIIKKAKYFIEESLKGIYEQPCLL